MSEEFKSWWRWYVDSKTPEGYFTLPLEPKDINDMTPEEFDLLDSSEWEMINETAYGITYFLCIKKEDNIL